MDNNVNTNTENNVNMGNTVPNVNTTDATQAGAIPTNNGIIQPNLVTSNVITGESINSGVNTIQSVPTPIQPTTITGVPVDITSEDVTSTMATQTNGNNNMQEGYYKKFVWLMGIIVGGVLLISGILLYFLLNGSIENRNRLTCTKTIQGDGYEEHIRRYYTFDNGIMKRVYVTHTFTYDELTDEMYNQTFDEVINNENHFVTKYGLGTNIVKEDNVVKINAYDINYFNSDVKDIEKKNKDEKFICE